MFSKKKTIPVPQAMIHDGALVLSFDTSEMPTVARFDLDSLAQANFVIQPADQAYHLNLRDFSGQIQPIAKFTNKIDAHQALHLILQALVTYHTPKEKGNNTGIFSSIIKTILLFITILIIIFGLILMNNKPISTPETQITKTEDNNIDTQSTPEIRLPEGEIIDLDVLLREEKDLNRQ